MDKFNIHEAKTHFSKLIERVLAGEEIVIGKAGKPVAKLVPYVENSQPRKPGAWKGKVWLAPDWDSPETNKEIEDRFYGDDPEDPLLRER